jgi:putative phosphoesterase
MSHRELLLGIISDTHGLLRPEATAALRGADLILHAGDVGRPSVLAELRYIAPTIAVRGNVDKGAWAAGLPVVETVSVGKLRLLLVHELSHLGIEPGAQGVAAVVFGHSHQPAIETRDSVLFLNPGSAGPRRFKLPITIARARVHGRHLVAEIVRLAL